jgi:hypothetical protein
VLARARLGSTANSASVPDGKTFDWREYRGVLASEYPSSLPVWQQFGSHNFQLG